MQTSSRAPRQHIASFWREWLVLAGLLFAFTALGVYERWFWRVDTMLYDAGLSLWTRPAPADIILIAIDEPSLARLGRWPWSRTRLADAIAAISRDHPRAILVDVILAEPQTDDGGRADEALAAALRAAGNVVLPVIFAGKATELVPLPAFQAAARLGHVQLELDPDGIARTVYLYEGLNRSYRPHVALALLEAAGERTPAAAPANGNAADGIWRRADWRYIPYAGPPAHFRQLPVADVIEGAVSRGTFERAYVLLGATAAGLGDANPTPTSGFSRPMPGIEVNANVLAALRGGQMIVPVASGWVTAASLLVLGTLLAGYLILPSRGALIATVLTFGAALAGALVALRAGSVWLPPATLLAVILLAYPLWSWRRLEAAQRFLDLQLADLGGDAAAEESPVRFDPLVRRIARVRAAQVRLAQTARERDELMKFLTHDMRTPQTMILDEIELRRAHAKPELAPMDEIHFEVIEEQARKSLALAEEFVQLTRTGWLTLADQLPVKLSVVADDATEETQSIARDKGVRIERAIAPDAWTRGEAHMLFRALHRLLQNAVRFTPAGGVVTIAVELHGDRWWCTVSDQGAGSYDPALRSLPDSGASVAASPGGGTVPGLALVEAVAARHQGELTITGVPGHGSTFQLSLPYHAAPTPISGRTRRRRD